MPATVRVNLITFRRPELLPRAVESLRRQTYSDWTCEIQNGDPSDDFPARLLAGLKDPRFTLHTPAQRTGPVAAFNFAHTPAAEPYQSILEDDNWWEPRFLEVMVAELQRRPEASLAWANMRIWQELPGNQWKDTGNCVWDVRHWTSPRIFRWPQALHFNDILYSNGAMLLRSKAAAGLMMPESMPRDMIEHTRERLMAYPIVLVPEPLANFSVTLQTFRSTDYTGWAQSQALLGGSFLRTVPMTAEAERELWAHRRALRPRSTGGLFFSALVAREFRFLRHANLRDWTGFLAGCIRHPRVAWETLRGRARHPQAWDYLVQHSLARTAEARAGGFTRLGTDTVLDKHRPAPEVKPTSPPP